MVRAGLLRNRVTIQAQTETQNVLGERELTWTNVATVWAEARAVSGRERLLANTEVAITDYLVRMRFRSDVTPDHRLELADGTLLDIENVIPDQKKTQLELMCKERTTENG